MKTDSEYFLIWRSFYEGKSLFFFFFKLAKRTKKTLAVVTLQRFFTYFFSSSVIILGTLLSSRVYRTCIIVGLLCFKQRLLLSYRFMDGFFEAANYQMDFTLCVYCFCTQELFLYFHCFIVLRRPSHDRYHNDSVWRSVVMGVYDQIVFG